MIWTLTLLTRTLTAPVLAAAALAGCSGTLVKPVLPMECPVAAELLQTRCAAPQKVSAGLDYGQVLQIARQDRSALADCQARELQLGRSMQACQQAIGRYNQAVAAAASGAKASR